MNTALNSPCLKKTHYTSFTDMKVMLNCLFITEKLTCISNENSEGLISHVVYLPVSLDAFPYLDNTYSSIDLELPGS